MHRLVAQTTLVFPGLGWLREVKPQLPPPTLPVSLAHLPESPPPFCTALKLSRVLPPRNLVVGASRDTQHQQHQHVDEAASQRVGSTAWMPTSTAKRSGGALRILGDATEPECVP
jgi:hypothetical protein